MNDEKQQSEYDGYKTRILVVDDHTIVRQGLTQLINQEPDLVVCAEAENADQALETLEKQQVDLAIVDTSLEDATPVELVEKIKLPRPKLPVVTIPILEFLNQ